MFLKEVSYFIKNRVKTVILWTLSQCKTVVLYNTFKNDIDWLAKLNFQHLSSSLQSHDPSEIILMW